MTIKSLLLTGLLLVGTGCAKQAEANYFTPKLGVVAVITVVFVGFPVFANMIFPDEKAKQAAEKADVLKQYNNALKSDFNNQRDVLIAQINRAQAEYSYQSLTGALCYFCSKSYAQRLNALPAQIKQWQTELRDIESKLNSLT